MISPEVVELDDRVIQIVVRPKNGARAGGLEGKAHDVIAQDDKKGCLSTVESLVLRQWFRVKETADLSGVLLL